jgi:hypothetical protein
VVLRRGGFDGGLKKPALGGRFFLVWGFVISVPAGYTE